MKATALVLALALLPAVARGKDDLSRPAEKVLRHALDMARNRHLRDRLIERLEKQAAKLSDEDLHAVVDRVRAETKPLKSLPQVRALLAKAYIRRRYDDETARRLPKLLDRMEDVSIKGRLDLLAQSLLLQNLKLARELALRDSSSQISRIRCRAAIALGGLIVWGAGTPEVTKTLTKMLDDSDAAVQSIACRAAFRARLNPVYPWAVAHLDDSKIGVVKLAGKNRTFHPGEEALADLLELTWLDVETNWEDFHFMKDPQKKAIEGLFTAWWKRQGEQFPVPGFREAVFRSRPSRTEHRVLKRTDTSTLFQFWSGLDRTRIRLSLENISLVATTLYDWEVDFDAHYMAQGMRSDDGEGYARHHPVTQAYILARKAIGCYVLTFRPLFDGGLMIRLSFHDPLR